MKKKRDYDNDFPSVTQVLDVLRKPGLEMWYRVNTPQFINEAMSKGKSIGSATHEAIETYINTGELKVDTEWPDEVTMALKSFVLFKKEHPEVKLTKSETKMTSSKHSFNGTMDIMGEIDGMKIVGDWKTTAAKDKEKPEIYDEAKTQVSAYRELYNEVFNECVGRAFIVSLAKDKEAYSFEIIENKEINDRFENIFIPALTIKSYQRRPKNAVQ
jgi:hypothetical protein